MSRRFLVLIISLKLVLCSSVFAKGESTERQIPSGGEAPVLRQSITSMLSEIASAKEKIEAREANLSKREAELQNLNDELRSQIDSLDIAINEYDEMVRKVGKFNEADILKVIDVLKSLPRERAASFLSQMSIDTAADLLLELDTEVAAEVLALFPDASSTSVILTMMTRNANLRWEN